MDTSSRRMGSFRRRNPTPARSRRGFTLAELLVGLVVGTLVIGLAFGLVTSHGRHARVQSERAALLQGARAAAELIASELRQADPLGIMEGTSTSVRFRRPRAWGVVCRHTPNELTVLFPTAVVPGLESLEAWISIPPVATSVEWAFVPVADRTNFDDERATAVAACLQLQPSIVPAAGAASQARLFRAREWNGEGGTLGLQSGEMGLEPGRTLYLFETVRYDVSTTSSGPGSWLRRSSGPAMQMHPLVGPLAPRDGLKLRYLDERAEELSVPLDIGRLERVRSVEVGVRTRSRFGSNGPELEDSVRLLVQLRNVH